MCNCTSETSWWRNHLNQLKLKNVFFRFGWYFIRSFANRLPVWLTYLLKSINVASSDKIICIKLIKISGIEDRNVFLISIRNSSFCRQMIPLSLSANLNKLMNTPSHETVDWTYDFENLLTTSWKPWRWRKMTKLKVEIFVVSEKRDVFWWKL